MKSYFRFLLGASLALQLIACGPGADEELPALAGTWRAVLTSPGGELPFQLVIEEDLTAWVRNGDEQAPLSHVTRTGNDVELAFAW